jgi:predicted transcriptional regulator
VAVSFLDNAPVADRELEKVRRTTVQKDAARDAWEEAIRVAAEKASLRKIADAAGVTHETIRTIVRGKDSSAAP